MDASEGNKTVRRIWKWFTRPSARYGWGILFALGAVAFLGIAVTFNTVLEATNKTEFCISCHTMQTNYEEYKKSAHYANRTGVRVECADCHVPQDFGPKMWAKLVAAKDVFHQVIGTIDTPEKFEAHRMAMAQRVWDKMEATGSRECRSCHDFQAMDFQWQGRRSAVRHQSAMEEGKTCINCHQGVVHSLPQGFSRD